MLAHLQAPLPLQAIAQRLRLSPKRLRGLCLRALGCLPSAYYLRLRLDHAKALLETTQMPITQIAFACGFASHAGFSRTFRQRFGMQPRQARQGAGRPGTTPGA
jgi:AraC family carnitine catabolism transcriptional activator